MAHFMKNRIHVPQEVKDRVDSEIRRCIEIAEREYNRTFRFPTVVYKKRGRVAGTACDLDYSIDINSVLLMENLDIFIDGRTGRGTITHEFAHLVDGIVNPETRETEIVWGYRGARRTKRSVHGPSWRRIMRMFGAKPSRCHTYDTTNSSVKKRSSKKHVWVCGCGNGRVVLTDYKHNKQIVKAPTGYGVYKRGHTSGRCGVYTYQGLSSDWNELPTVKSRFPKAANPAYPEWATKDLGTVTPRQAMRKAGLSKVDLCLAMYKINFPMPRQKLIQMFMDELGMSKACASTYYSNTKKKIQNGA